MSPAKTARRLAANSSAGSKVLLAVAIVALGNCLASSLSCYVQPSSGNNLARRGAVIATTMAMAGATPVVASAAGKQKKMGTPFGYYRDPNHPQFSRRIDYDYTETLIFVFGKDVGYEKEFELPVKWEPGSDSITIDFSAKGGPKEMVAKWEGDGFRFPDGNKWTRLIKR
eukprot:TRINITY_DN66695_c0_g1_i1.p1 TRINITY_DN66695_c0_g1~~TRINITY_DN66695_c0_g1_i1.p1  ORF type:complete len:170 (-),score=33.67 TRINITY_DN66695_c0_g1_i1:360-869(-)